MRHGLYALSAGLLVASAISAQESRAPAADLTADTAALAQDVTRANQLLGQIMSPFCPGLTLSTCPSPNAETLRVSIRERLAAGESPDAIMESLVLVYGEEVRGAPRPRGLGLVLWTLPFVALGVAAVGLAWWLHGHAGREAVPRDSDAPATLTPKELATLEAEQRRIG